MIRLKTAHWLMVLAGLATACSSTPKANDGPAETEAESAEVGVPPQAAAEPAEPTSDDYGPAPIQYRPIALILGPGQARAFAHAGVIQALVDDGIPIGALVGTEYGALIGAVYGLSETDGRFQWSLLKLDASTLSSSGGWIGSLLKRKQNHNRLRTALKDLFGVRGLKDARTPVRVWAKNTSTGAGLLVGEAGAAEAVCAAASLSGIHETLEVSGVGAIEAELDRPFPIRETREAFPGMAVVIVDVLGEPSGIQEDDSEGIGKTLRKAAEAAKAETLEADLVIRPEISDIRLSDFGKRGEAIFRGKKEARTRIREVRRLAGLPEIRDEGTSK